MMLEISEGVIELFSHFVDSSVVRDTEDDCGMKELICFGYFCVESG